MVKPSRCSGQRRKANWRRTTRGKLGSSATESIPTAATPVAASPRNFRLVMREGDKRFAAPCVRVPNIQNNLKMGICGNCHSFSGSAFAWKLVGCQHGDGSPVRGFMRREILRSAETAARPGITPQRAESETERRLDVDTAIRGLGGERSSLQGVGDVEEIRTQHAARIGQIHVIEDVAHANSEGEVVTAV